jgi:hypothetical protein
VPSGQVQRNEIDVRLVEPGCSQAAEPPGAEVAYQRIGLDWVSGGQTHSDFTRAYTRRPTWLALKTPRR